MTVRAATPEDAKRVWDSFEKPTLRLVEAALKAEGLPIGRTTIKRWRDAGWVQSGTPTQPTPEQVIEANGALLAQPGETPAGAVARLLSPPDESTASETPREEMLERACKAAAHTAEAVLDNIRTQPILYLDDPKAFGALMGAAGVLVDRAVN